MELRSDLLKGPGPVLITEFRRNFHARNCESLHLAHLGAADLSLYKAMQDWHNRVGDILAHVSDVLRPVGYDAIVRNDFAVLKEMLAGRRRAARR
jgi:hypothetical protein